jgi:hypothetical protein
MQFVRLFVLKSKVKVCRVGYMRFGGSVVEEKSSWLWFRVEDRKTIFLEIVQYIHIDYDDSCYASLKKMGTTKLSCMK